MIVLIMHHFPVDGRQDPFLKSYHHAIMAFFIPMELPKWRTKGILPDI
jgi:hypothetical protein